MWRIDNSRPMAIVVSGAVSCLLAGCGAASPLQVAANAAAAGNASPRPSASAFPSATSPHRTGASSESPGRTKATTTANSGTLVAPPQRGIDVVWYDGNLGPGNTVANESPGYVNYVKRLGANWLSITFPFFEASPTSSAVVRRSPTPSPADLSILIKDAQAAGLSVMLRPLLDTSTLARARVHWTPPNVASWFASYQRFLMPYAKIAQRDHVAAFTVGVEFDWLAGSSRWNGLDSAIRKVYKGQLAFANNWDQLPGAHSYGGPKVREDVDAYPAFAVPDNASIAVLTRHWAAWDSQLRRGTVLSEVGIPAQANMYGHPYYWKGPGPIVRRVQVRWFAAACNAVVAEHMGGIFFWSLPFGSSLTVPSGLANPGVWTATSAETEVSHCFSRLKKVK